IDQLRPIRAEIHRSAYPMATTVRASSRDNNHLVLEAAFCMAGGLNSIEKHYPEQVLDCASRVQRDCSLQQILMKAACENGYTARPGEYVPQGNLRQVLQAAFAPIHGAGFSTLAITNITSNVANKFLLDGFNELEDPWREIAAVKTVGNFKEHTFVR